jgi:uncharacterized membrane protein
MSGHDVNEYLARLERALHVLPAAERREILLETRSHILDRSAGAAGGVSAILAELGSPDRYAQQFVAQEPVAIASAGMLGDVARVAARGWRSLPLLLLAFMGYGIAALCVIVALWKLFEPDGVGFIMRNSATGRGSIGLVLSDRVAAQGDVLGWWIVPIGAAIAVTIHLGLAALLRRGARPGRA